MVRRWVYVVLGALVAVVAVSLALGRILPESPRHEMNPPGPVVVIGVPGLKWSQIDRSSQPGLSSLLQVAGTASITPRATSSPTCTADAWLSLGAGRAGDADCRLPGRMVSGSQVSVPRWSSLTDQDSGATPGLVASTLAKDKRCVTGVGRGGALAAADERGTVARYFAAPSEQALRACPVTFVDLGQADGTAPKNVDQALQPVFTHVPANATVLITGISDGGETEPAPRALLTVGPNVKRGALTSESTRQPGFVAAPDLAAHVLAGVENRPDELVGSPLTVRPQSGSEQEIAKDRRSTDLKLQRTHDIAVPYQVAAGVFTVLVLAIGVWGWRRSGHAPRWLPPAGIALACLPVASWLAGVLPWWRGGPTTLWFVACLAVGVALVISAAYAGPWREWAAGPPLVVAAITATVLGLDVIQGSPLQFIAPQGLQPLEGGRFFGMGNAGFGFFATAALLLGGLAAARLVWWDDADDTDVRLAAASVGVVGLAAAVIDGWPSWGADFGGPPAILIATAVLMALILGLRLTWRRLLLVGLGALVFVALAALVDWRRDPGSRTHLGRFVQQVADGEALGVLGDRLAANIALLFSSPVAPLVPVLLVLAWFVVLRPQHRLGQPVAWLWEEMPLLRWTCLGLLLCWSVAFLLNDSGVGVPATGAQLAVPLLLALAAAAHREMDAPRD